MDFPGEKLVTRMWETVVGAQRAAVANDMSLSAKGREVALGEHPPQLGLGLALGAVHWDAFAGCRVRRLT